MHIWIDNDGCPRVVRDLVIRASEQRQVPVTLVSASYYGSNHNPLVQYVRVGAGFDQADHHIAEHAGPGDLVITADIPLADRIVKKGATGISPRGEIFTPENIADKLSMRNFMAEMRSSGEVRGGPAPMDGQHKKDFANAFDRILTKLIKQSAPS